MSPHLSQSEETHLKLAESTIFTQHDINAKRVFYEHRRDIVDHVVIYQVPMRVLERAGSSQTFDAIVNVTTSARRMETTTDAAAASSTSTTAPTTVAPVEPNEPPEVIVHRRLTLNRHDSASIDTSVVNASDAEGSALALHILQTPEHGMLMLDGVAIDDKSDAFSFDNIRLGRLRYIPTGVSRATNDSLMIDVSDGVNHVSERTVFSCFGST